MRRRAGIGAIQSQKLHQDKFKEKGNELQVSQLEQVTLQMNKFREHLEEFASKHSHEIKKNPVFRKQFQEMCASVGVDPLASGKGFWSEMLGVGDFYYELGVQLVELCVATSHQNGGVLSVEEALQRLNARRKGEQLVSEDDIERAVKKLRILGSGMEVVTFGNLHFICSVPGELSMDHTKLLQEAESEGYVTCASMSRSLGWTQERSERALNHLLQVGMAWRDDQDNPPSFWFPGFFQKGLLVEN